MEITAIPGKMTQTWNADAKAVIDTWTNYGVPLEDFRKAVLGKGLTHAKLNGARAWIVDSSKATGTFSQEIQDFIGTDVFKAFAGAGIKYFITINSTSALTRMTVKNYSAKVGPSGIKLVDVPDLSTALDWLKNN